MNVQPTSLQGATHQQAFLFAFLAPFKHGVGQRGKFWWLRPREWGGAVGAAGPGRKRCQRRRPAASRTNALFVRR